MSLPQSSTLDIRSHTVDHKRFTDAKRKWSPRWAGGELLADAGRGRRGEVEVKDDLVKQRPLKPRSQGVRQNMRRFDEKGVRDRGHHRKLDRLGMEDDNGYDSWSDDSQNSPSETDQPAYSFDVGTGPTAPEQVLGQAVAKAVVQYEDRQTRELVREEYDVLDDAAEFKRDLGGRAGAQSSVLEEEDLDGFELV